MREEKDKTRGREERYVLRISRARISSEIVREARERAKNYCRIESLGPKKVHNNILLIKKIYRSEKKKTKKARKNAKNMINVAAYFETSFKHVRDTLNPTRKHDTRPHTRYDDIHHTVYFIVRL